MDCRIWIWIVYAFIKAFELLELKSVKTWNVFRKKYQYGTCFIHLKILSNLKKKSYLDLSMQSYGLLKFELQNCANNETERKR